MDIKNFTTGEHCFGSILKVNGIDYNDLDKKEVRKFIENLMDNDLNKELFIRNVFELGLEYLQANLIDSSSDKCDQCGNYNHHSEWEVEV